MCYSPSQHADDPATIVILVVPPSDKSKGGLVVALYMLQIFQANNPAIFLMLSRNSAGQTKKSVTYAITVSSSMSYLAAREGHALTLQYMGWAGGNAVSPQLFQARWAPRYLHSMHIHLALCESVSNRRRRLHCQTDRSSPSVS